MAHFVLMSPSSYTLKITGSFSDQVNQLIWAALASVHYSICCSNINSLQLSNLSWSKPKLSEDPSQAQTAGENAGAQSAALRTDDLFKRAEEISSYDLKVAMVIYYREDKRYEVYLSNRDFGSKCPFLEAIVRGFSFTHMQLTAIASQTQA